MIFIVGMESDIIYSMQNGISTLFYGIRNVLLAAEWNSKCFTCCRMEFEMFYLLPNGIRNVLLDAEWNVLLKTSNGMHK
jgi:hypothetical protein